MKLVHWYTHIEMESLKPKRLSLSKRSALFKDFLEVHRTLLDIKDDENFYILVNGRVPSYDEVMGDIYDELGNAHFKVIRWKLNKPTVIRTNPLYSQEIEDEVFDNPENFTKEQIVSSIEKFLEKMDFPSEDFTDKDKDFLVNYVVNNVHPYTNKTISDY